MKHGCRLLHTCKSPRTGPVLSRQKARLPEHGGSVSSLAAICDVVPPTRTQSVYYQRLFGSPMFVRVLGIHISENEPRLPFSKLRFLCLGVCGNWPAAAA